MTLVADGQEVLVVDGDERVRQGLTQLLTEAKLTPTVIGDPQRARQLIDDKFFAAVLVDLDTPDVGAGAELVRYVHERAPATRVFVMVARKSYDAAVDAFRAGAADVIVKAPDQIGHLRHHVVSAALDVARRSNERSLFGDALELCGGFFKQLLEAARRRLDLEDRLLGAEHNADPDTCLVLLLDPDGWASDAFVKFQAANPKFQVRFASTGGDALDAAGQHRFSIALVPAQLPDLPSSMVVSSLRKQTAEMVIVVYSPPGAAPGRAEVVEHSRTFPLVNQVANPEAIVARMSELQQAQRVRTRERRALTAFRHENYDLLRRFTELKQQANVSAESVDEEAI
jgi:DNA-binding NtrC family response regulator